MIIKSSILAVWIFQVILGAQFDVSINDFKEEVNSKVASEGANLMSRLETGVLDLQNTVTKHLNDLSDSLQQAASIRRFKRDTQVSESKFGLNFKSIINFVTCRYLTNIAGEISSTVGDSALLLANIMDTATNYSMALSNCSGNPICIMSVVLLTSQVVQKSMADVDKFIGDIRIRAQNIVSIFLACLLGETLPTQPPMYNSTTTETPAQNSTVNTTTNRPPSKDTTETAVTLTSQLPTKTTLSQKNQSSQKEEAESGESNSMENSDIKLSWR